MEDGSVVTQVVTVVARLPVLAQEAPPPRMTILFWNRERTAKARALWEAGEKAKDIASLLGCTKNAVVGKMFRMGILAPAKPVGRKRWKRSLAPKARAVRSTPFRAPAQAAQKVHGITFKDRSLPVVPTGITIDGLGFNTCKAVIGRGPDGLIRYCGDHTAIIVTHGVERHKSFCESHCLLYYLPNKERVR